PYAVVPACSSGANALAYVEVGASHELIEAATDPLPLTDPEWALIDPANPWTVLAGEVADFCEIVSYVQDSGYVLQRSWSNAAARAGTDPCVPAPSRPFYDTSTTPSTVQHVAAGASVTFTLRGFSEAPTADWTLSQF